MKERDCIDCGVRLVLGENWREALKRGKRYRCNTCNTAFWRPYYQSHRSRHGDVILAHQRNSWEVLVWREMVKGRAKRLGVPFDLPPDFFTIPERCPILGIPLERHEGSGPRPNAPTVDRKNPALGYVPENCRIISHRANTMRGKRTPDELWHIMAKTVPWSCGNGPYRRRYTPEEREDVKDARIRLAVWASYGGRV